LERPYLEKTYHKKRTDRITEGVGPEFKTTVLEKQKTNKKTQ
jgi:hypothetical protein